MKLKLVVAMSVLGLISSPVLAATTTKHKHHRHHHKAAPADYKGYKAMGALPVEPACTISQTSMILTQMTQNTGRSLFDPCRPDWFNRIALSGGMNIDGGKWGNRGVNFNGENYQRVALNDAYLNVTANVNDWTKAFASMSYNDTSMSYAAPFGVGGYGTGFAGSVFNLEQGYVTFANFDYTPIFAQLGKTFFDFSRYTIHPITRSLTQVLSEGDKTQAKVGFITPMGFTGSLYAFDNPINHINQTASNTDFGVSLAYQVISDALGWDIGVGYLYNMVGVSDIANAINLNNGFAGYGNRVGGIAAYGDVNSGPFSLNLRYTTAVNRFSAADIPTNNTFTQGAKPWAAGIQGGYAFNAWDKNQNIYLGYQASRDAGWINNTPRSRWLVGYNMDVWSNVNLGAEVDRDNGYSATQNSNGTSVNTNLVSLRAAVKFG